MFNFNNKYIYTHVKNDRYFGRLHYYIDCKRSNRYRKTCTRFNRVFAWSFTVPFSLNVIRYFAPSNIEVCRHAGDRKELNSFAQWETGSVFTRRAHGRLEVWNLLATRCSPLWTEFFERDDPIKIPGFRKKYANRGPALNYLKLPRENSMPSDSFPFLSFFSLPYILHAFPFTEIRRGINSLTEPFSSPLVSTDRMVNPIGSWTAEYRFFGREEDFLIVYGDKF